MTEDYRPPICILRFNPVTFLCYFLLFVSEYNC